MKLKKMKMRCESNDFFIYFQRSRSIKIHDRKETLKDFLTGEKVLSPNRENVL